MSDSKDTSVVHNTESAEGSDAPVTNGTVHRSPSAAPPPVVAPASSPPTIEEPLHEETSPPITSHNGGNGEADAHYDSEAETVISSPVKLREAQKRINGIKQERSDPQFATSLDAVVEADDETLGNNTVVHTAGSGDDVGQSNGHNVTVKEVELDLHGEGESDELSDVSSVHSLSSSGDAESRVSSRSGEVSIKDDHTTRNEIVVHNPRKRKYQDTSSSHNRRSNEPPRRRRRASEGITDAHDMTRSSEEPLPPSRPRRHRRTNSAQSLILDSHGDAGQVRAANASGRQRRAAKHFPNADGTASKHTWESDNSSETSHQLQNPQSRLTRSINRSVSTPGRSMGRDHKRHVNKYGFTRLAEACESGDLDMVKKWRDKDPEQLEQREFAGNTPLQVASLNGYPEIVEYLLAQGCNLHCANTDKDTPLIDAVENGHIDVVRLLLDAGVDPLRQNMKGQQALDVITDQTEESQDMRALLRKAIEDWTQNGGSEQSRREEETVYRPGPTKGLQFMARTYENLLKLVSDNDRPGVQEFLDARVPVDNAVVAAAARTGDLYLVNMLLAEMTSKKARQRPDRPMLAVIGTSHFEMVKTLTELDQFNPVWRSKSTGLTWHEVAEQRQGPNWRQEKVLLQQLYEDHVMASRLSSSPVTKRENGKRRRASPAGHGGSDVEMDDPDSPDLGRSRRRLMSKKAMRAVSNRRSSSSSPTPSSSPPAIAPADQSPPQEKVKRKVGRPRTKSLTNNASEPHPKRARALSMRDRSSLFDSPQRSRDTGHAIMEDAEEETKQEALVQSKADRKAEADAAIEKIHRIADDARKAENARKEDEARRQADEIRVKREEEAEERRIKYDERVAALPSALRHVIRLTASVLSAKKKYIQRHFLPIQAVKRSSLGDDMVPDGDADDSCMLSYQAAGILTGADAAFLLDLPTDPSTRSSALSDAISLPVTHQQRSDMLACLQSSSLVHDLSTDQDSVLANMEELAMADRARQLIIEDRAKFLAMPSLRWVRYRDFCAAAAAPEQTHLHGVPLDVRFDACLDAHAFRDFDVEPAAATTRPSSSMSRHNTPGTGAESGSGDVTPRAKGQGLVNGLHSHQGTPRATTGLTKVTIVQD